jgi:hypothetical protein
VDGLECHPGAILDLEVGDKLVVGRREHPALDAETRLDVIARVQATMANGVTGPISFNASTLGPDASHPQRQFTNYFRMVARR